jgi:hypothetical protein
MKINGWLAKLGWPDHPILAKEVAKATPMAGMGVNEVMNYPHGQGGGLATPKGQNLFFFFFFVWPFGGGRTTSLAMGVVRPPQDRPWDPSPWPN